MSELKVQEREQKLKTHDFMVQVARRAMLAHLVYGVVETEFINSSVCTWSHFLVPFVFWSKRCVQMFCI